MAQDRRKLRDRAEIGIALPDPVAMAVALDPAGIAVELSRHRVEVKCASELTRGMTVVDRLNVSNDDRNRGMWHAAGEPTIHVVWKIDVPSWKGMLFRALSG